MKIGELAIACDTPADTIRYYERQGLLPAPARTQSNYRQYSQMHLTRLCFIRRCRRLDMSLHEVRELLRVHDDPQADHHTADRVLDAHIGHVSQRIRELRALQRQLKALRACCGSTHDDSGCGILAMLAQPVSSTALRARRMGEVHGL